MNPGGGEPVAQPLQKEAEPPFGGSVEVVALAPPVAGHRTDGDDAARPVAFLQVIGQVAEGQDRAGEVGVQDLLYLFAVLLRLLLVTQKSEDQDYQVEVAALVENPFGELFQGCRVEGVELEQVDPALQAQPEIGGKRFELAAVAGGQDQVVSLVAGQAAGNGLGNGRFGSENQGALCHEMPSLSDCAERKMSSGS